VAALGLFAGALALAQQPGGGRYERPMREQPTTKPAEGGLVEKMMTFDKDKDGKLKKDEVTDERLARLFDKADADKDGTVTKAELEAIAKDEAPRGGGRGPGGGGRGPGGPGGPPEPGMILPPFIVDELKLTEDQKKKLDELQKETTEKLNKLLTDAQKKQLKEFAERGPGGEGPGGGRGPGGGGRGPGGEGPGGGRGPGGPGGGGRGPGGDR